MYRNLLFFCVSLFTVAINASNVQQSTRSDVRDLLPFRDVKVGAFENDLQDATQFAIDDFPGNIADYDLPNLKDLQNQVKFLVAEYPRGWFQEKVHERKVLYFIHDQKTKWPIFLIALNENEDSSNCRKVLSPLKMTVFKQIWPRGPVLRFGARFLTIGGSNYCVAAPSCAYSVPGNVRRAITDPVCPPEKFNANSVMFYSFVLDQTPEISTNIPRSQHPIRRHESRFASDSLEYISDEEVFTFGEYSKRRVAPISHFPDNSLPPFSCLLGNPDDIMQCEEK